MEIIRRICQRALLVFIFMGINAAACTAVRGTVNGKVTGISDDPLVRAVVYVSGTSDQTVTDETGRFSINIPTNRKEILIQSLGYQEIAVQLGDDRNTVEVELKPLWKREWLLAMASQKADPDFEVNIDSQTFPPGEGPIITVDEGHHNFHTAAERYSHFADILKKDGYVVARSGKAFTAENLDGVEILVVATPLNGMETGTLPAQSAFKDEEITQLRDWVHQGGSLFLVSDHMPIPGAFENLLQAFGVRALNGVALSSDTLATLTDSTIIFRRSDGSLRPHLLIDGLNSSERINSVASQGGCAFQVGEDFQPLFVLPDNVVSLQWEKWFCENYENCFGPDVPRIPVGGWLQAAVGKIGKGRVAIMGEAGMFAAQIRGKNQHKSGLSDPRLAENPQFILNVMHWLSGQID
ncbi:MAG: carboxypeptidase-like regulatory domain-containing protein [Deltaproteobacteria bacterium]|nr:carboxypeptidase-like regulatory domain-containing protein [Deltaproteobacteria bacterium]